MESNPQKFSNTTALSSQPIVGDIMKAASVGTIIQVLRGSIAHGTYVPSEDEHGIDDIDALGIVIAPINFYFGLTPWGSSSTREYAHGPIDLVEYEIRKFVSLLLNCNPNMFTALWGNPEHILQISRAGARLREARDNFLSKRCFASFTGYAHGQLKKMTALACQGYMGQKRKQLVEKYGYDTKNAAHCIRLYRMGCELLETGKVNIDRSSLDASELISIKRGGWTLERVYREADKLEQRAKEAYERSPLPLEPNRARIEGLLIDILCDEYFCKRV